MVKAEQAKVLANAALDIAVVDDDPLICDLLRDALGERGHRVTGYTCPAHALQAAQRKPFDVIVSDMRMQGMDGVAFYHALRACDPQQAARVVFISGQLPTKAVSTFLEQTGCPYLRKPFRLSELHAAISETLQRTTASATLKQVLPSELLKAA